MPSEFASRLHSSPWRWLWLVALASLGMRAWVSVALPITGDEALFYWWARYPDWGYYDHPPMVAWWIAAMRPLLGDATWSIRLPVVLLPLGVGAALWWAWAPIDRRRAAWAVLLFWLAPVNWLNALITTDSPLILWTAWSVAALVRAEHEAGLGRRAWRFYAWSGLFLGAAILSKYFAVLLGLSYLLYFAAFKRGHWRGMVLMGVCALPAIAVNLGWNLTHCWTNIMFNVYNRNEDATFSIDKPLLYLAMMAYLVGPVAVWQGVRHRQALWRVMRSQPLLACVALVPLACFGLMSGKKLIGLHWVMGFYPFLFVLMAWMLPLDKLATAAKGLAVLLLVHLAVVVGVSMTSLPQWRSVKPYAHLVQGFRSEQMIRQVQAPGAVLMTNGYTPSSIYGYALKTHVPVFGLGSVHARQDDLVVDYAAFDGRTLRVVNHNLPALDEYRPYFDSVRLLSFEQDGIVFFAVEGVGFRYALYREQIMGEISRRYYRFPAWLPVWGCAFCQHYCGANRCDLR